MPDVPGHGITSFGTVPLQDWRCVRVRSGYKSTPVLPRVGGVEFDALGTRQYRRCELHPRSSSAPASPSAHMRLCLCAAAVRTHLMTALVVSAAIVRGCP